MIWLSILRPDSAIYDIKIQEADALFQLSSANRIDTIGLKGDIKCYFQTKVLHDILKFLPNILKFSDILKSQLFEMVNIEHNSDNLLPVSKWITLCFVSVFMSPFSQRV